MRLSESAALSGYFGYLADLRRVGIESPSLSKPNTIGELAFWKFHAALSSD